MRPATPEEKQAHLVVRVEADSACQALHRSVQACCLHGIGITLVRRGIKFVIRWRPPDDDLLMLRQYRFAANAAILIAYLSYESRKQLDRRRNWRMSRPLVPSRARMDRH